MQLLQQKEKQINPSSHFCHVKLSLFFIKQHAMKTTVMGIHYDSVAILCLGSIFVLLALDWFYCVGDRLCGQSSWLQIRRPGFDSRH
jgi:hypothetical protein